MEVTLHTFAAGATTDGNIKLMSCRMPTLVQLRYIIQLQWNERGCDIVHEVQLLLLLSCDANFLAAEATV